MDILTLRIQRLFFWKAANSISILHSMHQRNKLCQLTMSMYCKWHIVARSKQETEGRGGLRPLSPKWLLLPTSQCNLKEGMSNVNTLESSNEVLTHTYMKIGSFRWLGTGNQQWELTYVLDNCFTGFTRTAR